MKGVVFNALEAFIVNHSDEATYEEIFASCPLHSHDGYVGPGTYPDSDLMSIVAATCKRLNLEVDDAIELFGEFLFPILAQKHPEFVVEHTDPMAFLRTVDQVIHVEVRKLMRGSKLPEIVCTDGPDHDSMVVTYKSDRQLCKLMRGLLKGVAKHFQTEMNIRETECVRQGADACRFELCKVHATVV